MGMAVAISLAQSGYRFSPSPDTTSLIPTSYLAAENTGVTINTIPFRLGVQVRQLNSAISPSQAVRFYPFYSVNGGSYLPIVRKGNSTLANDSPIVSVLRDTTASSGVEGDYSAYITNTTRMYNVAYGTLTTSEVSYNGITYSEAALSSYYILVGYFQLQYPQASENDVIRVRLYGSYTNTDYITVSALQSGISSGDVVPLDAGYTQTAEITAGNGHANASPIVLQEPLVLNGDTGFGMETFSYMTSAGVAIGSAPVNKMLIVNTSTATSGTFVNNIIAYGWEVESVGSRPLLNTFDLGRYSMLFIDGSYNEADFGGLTESGIEVPIITDSTTTAFARLGVGTNTGNSVSPTSIVRSRTDPRTANSSYAISISQSPLYDIAGNWSAGVNGHLHVYAFYTNYAWIAERISSNGYPRIFFLNLTFTVYGGSYPQLAVDWATLSHHANGENALLAANLSWSTTPEL